MKHPVNQFSSSYQVPRRNRKRRGIKRHLTKRQQKEEHRKQMAFESRISGFSKRTINDNFSSSISRGLRRGAR